MKNSVMAAHLVSRICHDFASPLTSVCNGVELLQSDNESLRAQAPDLIEMGTSVSLAKLSFLRYAFGSVGMQEGDADYDEIRKILDGFFDSPRLLVEWPADQNMTFMQARIGLNLALLAAACLPAGGVVSVSAGEVETASRAHEGKIRIPDFFADALAAREPGAGWSARTIHPVFAASVCMEAGLGLSMTESEDDVVFLVR